MVWFVGITALTVFDVLVGFDDFVRVGDNFNLI